MKAGFASTDRFQKKMALDLIQRMEEWSIGGNNTTRRALGIVYKRQTRSYMLNGHDRDVVWLNVMASCFTGLQPRDGRYIRTGDHVAKQVCRRGSTAVGSYFSSGRARASGSPFTSQTTQAPTLPPLPPPPAPTQPPASTFAMKLNMVKMNSVKTTQI
jgi:hypothetical protein